MEKQLEMAGGGTLFWRQEGSRVLFRAERPADGLGLYKVWLCDEENHSFLLGTLAPEGTKLCLFRSVAQNELERAGCWPLKGARAKLVFRFQQQERWYWEAKPGSLISDPVLRSQIQGPMLCRKTQDQFWLAVPLRTDRPMPLESLMCLAQIRKLESGPHWVWQFDRDGWPLAVHKQSGVESD